LAECRATSATTVFLLTTPSFCEDLNEVPILQVPAGADGANAVMMQLIPVLKILGVVVLAGLPGGCGDSFGGRRAISGTITFQGKPLDQG
jgi:hypothetical protein